MAENYKQVSGDFQTPTTEKEKAEKTEIIVNEGVETNVNLPTIKDVKEIVKEASGGSSGIGSGFIVVDLSEESGELTEEQFEILKGNNALIKYDDVLYTKSFSDGEEIYYTNLEQFFENNQVKQRDFYIMNNGHYSHEESEISRHLFEYFGNISTADGGSVFFNFVSGVSYDTNNLRTLFNFLQNDMPVIYEDENNHILPAKINKDDVTYSNGNSNTVTQLSFDDGFSIVKLDLSTNDMVYFDA